MSNNLHTETLILKVDSPASHAIMSPVQKILESAKNLVVADDGEAQFANTELKAILTRRDELDAERKGITRPLDEAKARVMDKYRAPIDALEQAAGFIKKALVTWTKKVEDMRRAEEARLQQIAREAAAKLEAQAARAEAKGQTEKAAMLTTAAAATAAAVPVLEAAPKLEGSSIRKTYKARVTNKERAIAALLANPMLAAAVIIDESALNKLASNFKEAFKVDGCELVIEEGLATRR